MKRICLVDVDSKIPNLSLMKISSYHKQNGDIVCLNLHDPEKVYVSVIFKKNKNQALGISTFFKCPVIYGGYGVNNTQLPPEIEHIIPDYSLFNCDYSLGFTSRGCIRNCPWCIVPQMEGKIRVNSDIYEFWDHNHKHIVLLDNNILALPKHFKKISNQLMTNKLSVDFNQGLDIRLLNEDNINYLSCLNVQPEYRFAFDDPGMKDIIIEKCKLLNSYDIRGMFYVLVGFNTTFKQDMDRINILTELGQRAYVMRYETVMGIQPYTDLAHWVNGGQFQDAMDFKDYQKVRHNRNKSKEVGK